MWILSTITDSENLMCISVNIQYAHHQTVSKIKLGFTANYSGGLNWLKLWKVKLNKLFHKTILIIDQTHKLYKIEIRND